MFNLWSTSGGLLWQTELVDKSEEAWRPPGGLATHGSLAAANHTQKPQNAVKYCSSITTESKSMKCVYFKGGSSETHKQPHSFPFSCPLTSFSFWWVIGASMEGGAPPNAVYKMPSAPYFTAQLSHYCSNPSQLRNKQTTSRQDKGMHFCLHPWEREGLWLR